MGIWGFESCNLYAIKACQTSGFLENIYNTLTLVRGRAAYGYSQAPLQLVIAQWLIPGVALIVVAKLFLAGIRRDMRVFLARRKKQHTIICGLGGTGMLILGHLGQNERHPGPLGRWRRRRAANVVVIERNAENPFAATCERQGIAVLAGDATQPSVLAMAGVARARSVIVCTGDDATNLDIALRVKELARGNRQFSKRRLELLMELRSEWFFAKLVRNNQRSLGSATCDLRAFNTYENAARVLLQKLTPPPDSRLDGGTFVLVGFGAMGREIVLGLLRSCPAPLGGKPSIMIFDRAATAAGKNFLAMYPGAVEVGDLLFCDADFLPGSAAAYDVVAGALGARLVQTVFVALPDDAMSLNVALDLRRWLDRIGHVRPPVHARLGRHRRLGGFLQELESLDPADRRLGTFGAWEELLDLRILFAEKLDRIAIASHEQWRADLPPERRENRANCPWFELAESSKSSNRDKADHIALMLAEAGLSLVEAQTPASIALTPGEIELLAHLEHRRWRAELVLSGWTYGLVRDRALRKHENLKPWQALSEPLREENRRAIAALPSLLARAGFEIRRPVRVSLFDAASEALPALVGAARDDGNAGMIVLADTARAEFMRGGRNARATPGHTPLAHCRRDPGSPIAAPFGSFGTD